MNKKDYLKTTKTLAKITRIICRISIIASLVGVALLAISTIVTYAIPADRIMPLQNPEKLNVFLAGSPYVPSDVFTSMAALHAFLMGLLARLTVCVAVFIVVALHVIGLLKSVENGSPFEIQNVTRLRKISVAILIGSCLIPAVTSAAAAYTVKQSLLDAGHYSMVDVTLLLCGFLVLILSGIFAYGARLQREYDQTV